jgi:integrase
MSEKPQLIEKSFADAIVMILAAQDLLEQTRRHWASSLRVIARVLDRPLEVIPARYSAVRADLGNLHAVPTGMTVKTLQNHKSNVKSALLWLAKEKGVPEHGAPLNRDWAQLRDKIDDPLVRYRLSSLMRFCSAASVGPAAVDETVIDKLLAYRVVTGKPADKAFRRLLARAWNGCVDSIPGWPSLRLQVPPPRSRIEVDWSEFPEGLRRDIERYLAGLTKIRRARNGQRIRPLKPSTIRTRRAELKAAARMAVKAGVPIATLTSLAALLAPEVAEKVIDAYWRKNGETPAAFTIDLAGHFVAIAREIKCLGEAACVQLEEMAYELDQYRNEGLTEKNRALIRQVYSAGVWARVLELPRLMMIEAYRQRTDSPLRAAVTAQLAVAIVILTVAPVRLANLTAIRIDTNLIRPGGIDENFWLHFPNYDVKNRVKLDFPLDAERTQIITNYIHDFRPRLLRGRNEDWLFPGQRQGAKQKISFSGQITDRIYEATGLRITVHQFRHAAGAIILKHRPGEYELVRQLLGHRSVQTTIRAYIGLEGLMASEIFGQLISEEVRKNSQWPSRWKSGRPKHV